MENEIKLLKNNQKRNWSDLEWINEFYEFLQRKIPENISLAKGHSVKLSKKKAFAIIWYLQEHLALFPDNIEQCTKCGDLYNSYSSGYHSELTGNFYCDSCFPPFLDEREQKILERRYKKQIAQVSDTTDDAIST